MIHRMIYSRFLLRLFPLMLVILIAMISGSPADRSAQYYAQTFEETTVPGGSNVRDHGAAGDGIIDDSDAIQLCIAEIGQNNGAVFFPAGTYRIGRSLRIPSNITLVFSEKAMLSVDSGYSLNMNGSFSAGDHRIIKGSVYGQPVDPSGNPLWFGAKGDGVTDDSQAFITALALFKQVDIPESKGYVVGGIVLRSRQILQGRDGKKVRLNGLAGASDIIIIQGSDIIVRNLEFDMSKNTTANCIKFNNKSMSIEKCTVSNITARNAGCVITDADSANMVITTTMENIESYSNRGTAFKLNDFWGFIFLSDIFIDNSSLKSDFPAVYVKDNAGLIVRGLTIKGGSAGSTGHGVHFHNSVAVWMADVDIDDAGGAGIMFTGSAQHFYIRNSQITGSGQYGIYSTGTFMQLHDIDVSDSGNNGIQIAGENFQLSEIRSERNNGHGIYCISLNYSSFSDITVNGNSKFGVFDEGGSNSFFNITGDDNANGLANAHAVSRSYDPGE